MSEMTVKKAILAIYCGQGDNTKSDEHISTVWGNGKDVGFTTKGNIHTILYSFNTFCRGTLSFNHLAVRRCEHS